MDLAFIGTAHIGNFYIGMQITIAPSVGGGIVFEVEVSYRTQITMRGKVKRIVGLLRMKGKVNYDGILKQAIQLEGEMSQEWIIEIQMDGNVKPRPRKPVTKEKEETLQSWIPLIGKGVD